MKKKAQYRCFTETCLINNWKIVLKGVKVYIRHELVDKMNSQYLSSTDFQYDKEFIGEGVQPLPYQSAFLKILVENDVENTSN